ncbi:MAG: alpha-amylase, partial [Actinobacteria bacterium]|nr:alpha-amylase [Actinomycetota bacterium]
MGVSRTPMRWDSSPNAGFCPEGVEPWLPLGGDSGKVNVALQSEDPRSMLGLTGQLLALRRNSPATCLGGDTKTHTKRKRLV